MHDYFNETVAVDSVIVPKGHRSHTDEQVVALADSIREIGLMNPITLDKDYRLVAGRGRLEAHKHLGLMTIPARITNNDDLGTELAELHENLIRSPLTAIEEATAIARCKVLYEAMHPETKHGGARPGAGRPSEKSNGQPVKLITNKPPKPPPAPSFVDDTAKRTGKSKRDVRRSAKIGAGLSPSVVPIVSGSVIENKKGELEQLAKLPSEQQEVVAQKIKSGEAATVQAALTPEAVVAIKDAAGNVIPESLVPRWNRAKQFESLAREVSALLTRIETLAKDEQISGWLEIHAIQKDCQNMRNTLRFCKPYILCGLCGGVGCARCRQTGWIVDSPAARTEVERAA